MDAFVILKALIALPVIFFIPGFVTFSALRVNKIENLKLSLFETLFLQVLASIVITGWIAFTLAQIGYFSLWLLCALLLAYSVIMSVIFRVGFRSLTFPKPIWNHRSAFLILLVLVAVFLFFRPSEEVNLEHDIGAYINTGANIAKTGSIVIHDPILSAMPDSARDTFYLMSPDGFWYHRASQWFEGLQFPDFAIVEGQSGVVLPYQPPLRQVWFAIFYAIFGLKGALYSQPLFGLIAVLSLFLVGKTVWNWTVGAIASSLLAVNFVQVFFSQYTSPEILFQLLTFGGIATLVLFIRTRNGFFGIVAAMCFGELFMTRLDALLILIPLLLIVFYILLSGEERKKIYLYFILPFLVLWFHSLSHMYFFCMPYLNTLTENIEEVQGISTTPTQVMVFLLGISLIVALALLFITLHSGKSTKLSKMRQKLSSSVHMPYFLMFIVILLIAYFWLTSPNGGPPGWVTNFVLIPPPRDFDPTVALSWFVDWLGLVLALLGLFSILHRGPYAGSYLFLGIISLTTLAYLYTLANNPTFPWAMRRLIPVAVPAVMILVGCGVDRISDWLTNTILLGSGVLLRKSTMILLVLALMLPSVSMNSTLLKPQFEGFVDKVSEVADFFPANAIVLEVSSGAINRLSVPLKYIYGRDSIYLWSDPGDADEFAEMVKLWNQEGREVYLIVYPRSRFDSISSKLSGVTEFKHEATFLLDVSQVAWEQRKFSNTRIEKEHQLEVYRLIPL